VEVTLSNPDGSRSNSPATSVKDQGGTNLSQVNSQSQAQEEPADPFDYQAAVNELTIQFISEFEETRVSALKWLIMLHQKVPKKVRVPLWHQLTRC
jgi:vacuole morphology and inheritance protein 14